MGTEGPMCPLSIAATPSLDKGEAEVIVLSKELGAGLIIIDELTARKVAIMMGLPVIGAAGLLMHAKRTGLIKEVKPLLDDMILKGIRYKESFYREVLKSIGEL
jgi:predicted nucleic acid-binding protein